MSATIDERRCGAQTYWYEGGETRAVFCGKPATRRTQGDAHIDESCDEHARMAIEAGARDCGPVQSVGGVQP